MDFEDIKRDLKEIRPDLDEISSDLDRSEKIDRRTTSIGGESYFQWDFRSGQLKIGFPCSNPSTDLPVSGFGIGELPPTVAGVGSNDFRYGSVGLGGWVSWRVWLDTPRYHILIKCRYIWMYVLPHCTTALMHVQVLINVHVVHHSINPNYQLNNQSMWNMLFY